MKRAIIVCGFLMISVLWSVGQNYFRSGIFLHHSTGGCIWGPNGSSTSIPQEMDAYNTDHGFTGLQTITMNEEWWSPSDNEWVTQHAFFEDPDPFTGIGNYLSGNKIIVIKTCFPASAMSETGHPSDTLFPQMKTIYNYKWHWRHIIRVMDHYRGNFFVIWTNAPLEPGSTNASEALLSKRFCKWAKDTLANGLDPELGAFPPNVYVFDFFRKLTGPNGMMLSMYAAGSGDSHPNAAATALVAPQFVTEIFDAAIGYELTSAIPESGLSTNTRLIVSPNPCRDETFIKFETSINQKVEISMFDQSGKIVRKILEGFILNGAYSITVSVKALNHGVYQVRCIQGIDVRTAILIVKR